MDKIWKCAFCDKSFTDIDVYAAHMEAAHKDMMIPGMGGRQFIYYLKTKRLHGRCITCHKDITTWNEKTNKYNAFCSEKCKQEYVKLAKSRMVNKYGKTMLLDDPEQQIKMLANRSISGVYKWSDGRPMTYTGSYELSFLKFLDLMMNFPSSDVIAPSPHVYHYVYEGEEKFYIPDFYIPSLNLEIEIKDGGDNANMHHKIQEVDKVKERLKDEVLTSNKNINYMKITNKENGMFFKYIEIATKQSLMGIQKPIYII